MEDLSKNFIGYPDFTGEPQRKVTKVIKYPYAEFNVNIIVDLNNQFVGIESIDIEKKFYNFKTKSLKRNYHDVDEFYKSE